jgi:hypothetical protein
METIVLVVLGVVVVLVILLIVLMTQKKKPQQVQQPIQQPVQPQPVQLQQPLPKVAPEHHHVIHKRTIDDFYREFDSFANDQSKIIADLKQYDYDKIDKGKLREFLEHHGLQFDAVEAIMNAIYKHFTEMKSAKLVEEEIPHYRNLGWDDKRIKEHFLSEGYAQEIVEYGFKEFHKKNIYANYINQIVKHMKPFVLSGKTDDEILNAFEDHNWPYDLLKEALDKTKHELEHEKSSVYLEEEILKLLLEGDSKDKIAKILTKKGWAEDQLKHHYDDISTGIQHLEQSLESIDLNQYNIDKIKQALLQKNWPPEIVDRTVKNLVEKVEYHRKQHAMKKEVMDLVQQGQSSQQIKTKLLTEGWPEDIANKMIFKVNRALSVQGDKEKIKTFNSHVFAKDEWHQHMNEAFSGFSEQDKEQHNSTDLEKK